MDDPTTARPQDLRAEHRDGVGIGEARPRVPVTSPAPAVRPVEELRPVSVTELRPGVHVVDLGQDVNGRVRLTDLGPPGTEITLTHGEALAADGDVTVEHLWRRCRSCPRRSAPARSTSSPRPVGPETLSSRGFRSSGSWGDRLCVVVMVPPGCVADVVLPDGTYELGPGTHRW